MAYRTIYDTVAIANTGSRFVICSGSSKGKTATFNNMREYGDDIVEFFDSNGGFDTWEWDTKRKVYFFLDKCGVEIGIVKQEVNTEKSRKEKERVMALENECMYVRTC